MKLTVIGTGYVGLVTGTCLAEVGNDVMCLDLDAAKIEMLMAGNIPIFEHGLQDLVRSNLAAGRLSFTTDVAQAVAFGQVLFIAVGTPPDEEVHIDMQFVFAAAHSIGRHMNESKLVVNKSTVPVGTAKQIRAIISDELVKRDVTWGLQMASNPEFLKEGAAVDDFMRPDRIVIGVESDEATALLCELFEPFQHNDERLVVMDIASAELTKYAANAMLAARISFMNELANLAEKLGANIEHVRRGIGSDQRIGNHFLSAGTGYGGSCLPKDVQALLRTAKQAGVPLRVLEAVEAANNAQRQVLLEKLVTRFGSNLRGKCFAVWGLAFKPETDDMREAPSRTILEGLWLMGATVRAYDPVAMAEAQRIFGERTDLQLVNSPMDALIGADALLIVTEWKPFMSPDFALMKTLLNNPVVFDGRNLYEPTRVRAAGLEYYSVGRE